MTTEDRILMFRAACAFRQLAIAIADSHSAPVVAEAAALPDSFFYEFVPAGRDLTITRGALRTFIVGSYRIGRAISLKTALTAFYGVSL
jgi:hypothetical protein